jgi:hypothetical protein
VLSIITLLAVVIRPAATSIRRARVDAVRELLF